MIIAGLTGGIGHGKTTLAHLLAAQSKSPIHIETWEIIAEVATALRAEHDRHPMSDDIAAINAWLQPLPDIVHLYAHIDVAFDRLLLTQQRLNDHPEHYAKLFEYLDAVQADPALEHIDIIEQTKEQFRPLLQWIGGYLVAKVGSGIWYDEIIRRIAILKTHGYELVTVGGVRYPDDAERIRNAGGSILEIKRPQLPDQDETDLTERQRSLITADAVIVNDGSLADLADCAAELFNDLRLRQLQFEYCTTQASNSLSHTKQQ